MPFGRMMHEDGAMVRPIPVMIPLNGRAETLSSRAIVTLCLQEIHEGEKNRTMPQRATRAISPTNRPEEAGVRRPPETRRTIPQVSPSIMDDKGHQVPSITPPSQAQKSAEVGPSNTDGKGRQVPHIAFQNNAQKNSRVTPSVMDDKGRQAGSTALQAQAQESQQRSISIMDDKGRQAGSTALQAQAQEICCETFACNADKKAHFEAMHFLCKPCKRWFPTSLERGEHYEISDKHAKDYCKICETIFPDLRAHTADHHARRKPRGYTEKPRTYSYRSNTRRDYRSQDDPHTPPRETPSRSVPRPPSGGIHYTTLGIDSSASHEQVVQAAKKRRIETHPDRLKRRPGLTTRELERIDEEAGTVGNAADILSSPALRAEYDKAVGSGAQR